MIEAESFDSASPAMRPGTRGLSPILTPARRKKTTIAEMTSIQRVVVQQKTAQKVTANEFGFVERSEEHPSTD
jgi:hypothetical protein